ncbi:hypothetical protein GGR50DRAFT_691309 [Xylaria sp. CBS 124048]|nr:hypothetical protein GGR50DRAFT_691309 [Xylaria sp. CBS 124048]
MSSSGHDDEPSPERPARDNASVGVGVGVGVGGATLARRVKKKRVRNFTENDRAAHRIFEKSRREAFKEALTNLANLLPALTDTEPQRLSKHVVVDESITFIKSQHEQIRTITEQLEAVKAERDALLSEVNHWRSSAGIEPRQANPIGQPAVRNNNHDSTGAVSEAIPLGALPTTLQSPDPATHIVAEAAPPFITNALHERDPSSLPTDSSASMHWESFESQIHPFGRHPNHVPADIGHGGIGNPGIGNPSIGNPGNPGNPGTTQMTTPMTTQIAAYPSPQSTNLQPFNVNRGQHGTVFLPYEPAQPFNPQDFPTDTYIQTSSSLQHYMPP